MDAAQNKALDTLVIVMVLLGLGMAMMISNRWFTFIDDEIAMLLDATIPAQQTIHSFTDGTGLHRHPPLYDLLLAGWLRLSGGRVSLLRVPAIIFYLLGLWFTVQAARWIAGVAAARAALWIGVVFPYGFHFGRIAGWYSFSFLTLALLTFAYLWMEAKPAWGRWVLLVVACELAVYTNYFLAVLIGLLALDYWIRHSGDAKPVAAAGATVIVILLGFLPLLRALLFRLFADQGILRPVYSGLATMFFCGYNVYTLFVSESVAPWFWYFSIPALAAIAYCSVLLLRHGPPAARRLFLGFLLCTLAMTLLNLINTKRLLFLSPWLLISLAAMLGSLPRPVLRKGAILALGLVGAIGWFGILSRRYYAAPRLIEPWEPVAERAAGEVRKGAVLIGNNPSFFFYLTNAIRSPGESGSGEFVGSYPVWLSHPQLFDPIQWLQAGQVYGPTTLLVKGATDEAYWGSTAATEAALDENCHLDAVERKMADTGFAWKQRWFADARQPAWRIEVRTYQCPSASRTAAKLNN